MNQFPILYADRFTTAAAYWAAVRDGDAALVDREAFEGVLSRINCRRRPEAPVRYTAPRSCRLEPAVAVPHYSLDECARSIAGHMQKLTSS